MTKLLAMMIGSLLLHFDFRYGCTKQNEETLASTDAYTSCYL